MQSSSTRCVAIRTLIRKTSGRSGGRRELNSLSRSHVAAPSNSAAAADGNRVAIVVGATLSRAVAAAERQAVGRLNGRVASRTVGWITVRDSGSHLCCLRRSRASPRIESSLAYGIQRWHSRGTDCFPSKLDRGRPACQLARWKSHFDHRGFWLSTWHRCGNGRTLVSSIGDPSSHLCRYSGLAALRSHRTIRWIVRRLFLHGQLPIAAASNSGLQPTWPVTLLHSKLCHYRVADRAAEPWSVGRRMMRQMIAVLFALLGGCVSSPSEVASPSAPTEAADRDDIVREMIVRYVMFSDDSRTEAEVLGPPWIYCVEFTTELGVPGISASNSFIQRFGDDRVRCKGNCDPQKERQVLVGSVQWIDDSHAQVWYRAHATRRGSGYSCLAHVVRQPDGSWDVKDPCSKGMRYG